MEYKNEDTAKCPHCGAEFDEGTVSDYALHDPRKYMTAVEEECQECGEEVAFMRVDADTVDVSKA